jgi:uncharacterized membrane protein
MSDLNNLTKFDLEKRKASLSAALTHFQTKAAETEAEIKDVVDALKTFADSAVAEVKAVAETVKEEVKAAPKKVAKKVANKEEAPAKTEKPKVEDTPAEEPAK